MKKNQSLLQQPGVEKSKLLYNHLAANENPNYPNGKVDDIHFNDSGAIRMAQTVLAEIKALKLELATRIVKPKK